MLDPLLAGILFTTVLLGLGLLRQGAASPATWFFFAWFVFTLTALVGLLDPESYRWLYDSYVIYGSLSPPLALGGTLILLDRSVPRWLLPGFLGIAMARFAVLEMGFPTVATAGALLSVPMYGVAASVALRSAAGSGVGLRLLGPAFAAFGVVAMASVLALVTMPGDAPVLLLRVWLVSGMIMLGVQLYTVGEQRANSLRISRDALEGLVRERTAELARINEALRSEIADHHRASLAREESEERYRRVSELSSDFSFCLQVDPEHGVRAEWVTEAFERITGHPAASLDGSQWAALFHIETADAASGFQLRLPQMDENGNVRCRIVHPSGDVRYLDVKLRQLAETGTETIRVVGAARDVTEARRVEQERAELERQVDAAQRVESLGMLTGGIAHDFNNLLAVILGNTRLAQEEQASGSPSIRKLARIRTAAEHAARLTEQMLTYSGKAIVSLTPIEPAGLIRDLGDLLQASVGQGCEFRVELRDAGVVEGDVTRLSQVILNLVANAYEALEDGRGDVVLRSGRDYFSEEALAGTLGAVDAKPGEYAWFEVADNGCGMDEETRRRIFEPFFSTKFSGRGLGLASALGIIHAHRGRVELSSQLGAGTRIRVLIPPSSQKPVVELAPEPVDSTPSRILIVDDDEAVLELAEEFLRRAGHEPQSATSGRIALELFQECASEIDVVVLDLTMPDLDGHEVFKVMREIRADIPVVVATGYSRGVLEERFPNETLLSFLRKPFEPEQLLEAILAASQPPDA